MNSNRWYILTLAALTNMFAIAVPAMCMPVLFKEISDALGLNLVQIGTAWGAASLSGIAVALIGGLLGDRFGVRKVLTVACFLAGGAGALRGLSDSFASLSATMFLFGLLSAVISVNVQKTIGIWFSGRQLGTANGVACVGMGVGFTLGAMFSATILSPLLGGWRNVLSLYGAISIILSMLWFLTVKEPGRTGTLDSKEAIPLRQALSQVVRIRNIWLLGITLFGYMGYLQGISGYLPLYLRESGWTAARADGALVAFNGAGTLAAIPLARLSDRLGSRKAIIFPALLITTIGIALLSVINGQPVWLIMIMVGIVRDAFMAIFMSMIIETRGIGATYAGTAAGLTLIFDKVGGFISPPLGNSLAAINPGLPFIFWAFLTFIALFSFYFVKETGKRQGQIQQIQLPTRDHL